jgi:hypothetical protein
MFRELNDFIFIDPKIPDHNKNYISINNLLISTSFSREKIFNKVISNSDKSELSLLTLYVYRQMDLIDWLPFIKAAIERNPVCFTDLNGRSTSEVFDILTSFPEESIYQGNRLALPDEVWNFRRGDGIEKALLLADFIHHKNSDCHIAIEILNNNVLLRTNGVDYIFTSQKKFTRSIQIKRNNYSIN